MMIPLRCGDPNRKDYLNLIDTLTQSRGDAISDDPDAIVGAEIRAQALIIYYLWCLNNKFANQLNPNTMSDYLERWEVIMGLRALPTDTVQDRRNRIAAKMKLISKTPNSQNVIDLLTSALGSVFLTIINTVAASAQAGFPSGTSITGGITNITNTTWFSTVNNLFIEVQKPSYMASNQFYATVNQIYTLLQNFLPAYMGFDWFWNGFCDSGNGSSANPAVITCATGSTAVVGTRTAWRTAYPGKPGEYTINAGDIIEAYDDNGNWQRMIVASVTDNTHLTITIPLVTGITNGRYVIQGIWLDIDSTVFPFPPSTALNLDNSAFG